MGGIKVNSRQALKKEAGEDSNINQAMIERASLLPTLSLSSSLLSLRRKKDFSRILSLFHPREEEDPK